MLFSPTCLGPFLNIACRSASTCRRVRRNASAAWAFPLGSEYTKRDKGGKESMFLFACKVTVYESAPYNAPINNANVMRALFVVSAVLYVIITRYIHAL